MIVDTIEAFVQYLHLIIHKKRGDARGWRPTCQNTFDMIYRNIEALDTISNNMIAVRSAATDLVHVHIETGLFGNVSVVSL